MTASSDTRMSTRTSVCASSQLLKPFAHFVRLTYLTHLAALVLAAACVVIGVSAVNPEAAQAKEVELKTVNISGAALDNGTLTLTEARTIELEGYFTNLHWKLADKLPENASIQIADVSVCGLTPDRKPDEKWTSFTEVPFETAWRESGSPGEGYYSLDTAKSTIYIFKEMIDGQYYYRISYDVVNVIQTYLDTAEFSWTIFNTQGSSNNCKMKTEIELPVPKGERAVAGENVQIDNEQFIRRSGGNIELTNNTVLYEASTHKRRLSLLVSLPERLAEMRVAFPAAWETNVAPDAIHTEKGSGNITTKIQKHTEEEDKKMIVLIALIGVGLIVTAPFSVPWVIGRKHAKQYGDSSQGFNLQ